MKRIALLCAVLLAMSASAFSRADDIPHDPLLNPFGYAHEAEESGDYPEALKIYKSLVETSSYAPFMVGIYYYEGKPGIPKDYRAALKWFTDAANYQYVESKRPTISTSLSNEKKKESARLLAIVEESTKQEYMMGVPLAQEWIGKMYYSGNGVPQDYAEAANWYRKAAERGNAESQLLLGDMYRNGKGVPQDYVMAHMWSNLAASGLTGKIRETAVAVRDLTASMMTPSQIADAQRLAREWRPKQPASTSKGRMK